MVNKFKNILRILLVLSLVLVIAGCGSINEAESDVGTTEAEEIDTDAEKVSIQLAHHHAVDSTVDRLASQVSELVEDKSDGSMIIDVFPASQLGEERELINGVDMGTIDMAMVSPSLMDDYDPIFGLDTLPFIFDDADHAYRAFSGEVGDELTNLLLEKSNIRMKDFIVFGARQMFTEPQIESLEDFKGVKVRSPESWVFTRMFELLGANPTPITFGEAYTALQTGVVDGMEVPPSMALDLNLNEVVNNVALTSHMFGTMSISMHEGLYQELSDEQNEILDESINETVQYFNQEIIPLEEEEALERLEEGGVTVNEVGDIDEWSETVESMLKEFEERAPGSEDLIDKINDSRN